jgi:asparagine synthase (glutamine-hydrolysing)
MCGIAGAINFNLPYQQLTQVMYHRGPDAQNGYRVDNIDLFHFRLSILDVAGGVQPMHVQDNYTIIFNGEIYNHAEIRSQLNLQGNTASDTETLLLLYQKYGTNFLHYLEGMFVFVIYDKQQKQLFIARDRAGKKPLYIYNDTKKIVFASELNALKKILPLQKNDDNMYHYLRLGSFFGSLTPYHHVTELAAGSFVQIDCVTLKITQTQWWNINQFYLQQSTDNFTTALAKTDELLHAAVKRRIESSDLEVGSFLSGGIDSGLVTAIASQYNNKLKTFTVSFDGAYDEAPLAQMVADKYGTQHTQIGISFNHLKNDVETILSNYGEPFFDSSAIPSYYVSAAAKKHVTVILNGDGADELFGGYRRYVPYAKYDFFKSNGFVKQIANQLIKIAPQPNNKKSTYNFLYRLVALASQNGIEQYLSAGVDIFESAIPNLTAPPNGYMYALDTTLQTIINSPISGLKKIMNMDFNATLFTDLLVKMDIATMAHSLEGRSPFLCKGLLEYAPTINDAYKINGSTTKYLLREMAKKYLPPTLINQPKRGFEIPLKNWVNNQLQQPIYDYLTAPNNYCSQFVTQKFIDGLLQHTIKMPAENRAKIVWTLFCLEVWYKKVYNLCT